MFSGRYIALALRKERLLERIEAQRDQLASYGTHLEKPFAVADKVIQVGRYIQEHPWIAGVAALSTALLGRRNLLRWAARGWTLWRGWRFARQWLAQSGYIKI